MNTNTQIKALLGAVVVVSALGLGTNANAGGFIGDAFKAINPGFAVIVDPIEGINANTKIFERTAGQVMDGYVPGLGTAYMATVQGGGVIPAPQRGGFVPVQQQLGARCATPQGVYGPGPVQVLGAFCQANTPWGPMNGYIVQ